ncbi:hypothetical protein [Methyloferula stellata]|uniref:hypothetical protein n=1 Tax=Methyloferula stellata TaxID=876270 RepID=UPI0003748A23|nr:hypothetical protein [Methyloferula stellata]
MADLFTAADWISALIFCAALAMTALSIKEIRLARLLIWIALLICTARWGAWAMITEANWMIRGVVGALMGGFILAAIPAAFHWIKSKDGEAAAQTPSSNSGAMPTGAQQPSLDPPRGSTGIKITGGSNIDLSGNVSIGLDTAVDAKDVSNLKARDNLTIDPSKESFIIPSANLISNLSVDELRRKTDMLAEKLVSLEASYENKKNDITSAWMNNSRASHTETERHDAFVKMSDEMKILNKEEADFYKSDVYSQVRAVLETLIYKLDIKVKPSQLPVALGYGVLAGPYPLTEAANVLKKLAIRL